MLSSLVLPCSNVVALGLSLLLIKCFFVVNSLGGELKWKSPLGLCHTDELF